VWPVATYDCESWALRKNEETRLDAFDTKGLRKILRISWTAKETNEWVSNKVGVGRELLDTAKARKLAYGHIMRNKKLSHHRGTARCVVSVEILPIATQQCRNYLYDKS